MTKPEYQPFFSIIIPTYNRAGLIGQTLDALCLQTFPDYEVIIIDDGGSDPLEEMLLKRNDARLHLIRTENRERGAARNSGVQQARGKYITFLDSDDVAYPNLFEQAKEAHDRFGHPPFFHIGYEIKNLKGEVQYRYDSLVSDNKLLLVAGNPLSCIGVFLRKDIALEHPFNEDRDLSGSEDWELWLRIVANYSIKTDNHICAAIINHPDRSVKQTDPEKLYKRKELALKYSFRDEKVRSVYGSSLRKIEGFADSYISLHLALSGYRFLSVKYLLKSIFLYPLILFNRRPLVIIKRIILGS